METCTDCGQQLDGVWVDVRVGGRYYRLCTECEAKDAPPLHVEAGRRPV